MPRIRVLALLAAMTLPLVAEDGKTSAKKTDKPPVKKALNKAFKGHIIKLKGRRVTFYYDFEDPAQLEDFEAARPPRLLDATQNRVRIRGGRLVLEGSSSIRHKMEGRGELRAKFSARLSSQGNCGTVFTEPIISDFFVVLNLFDERFYQNGNMLLAACGLHEDEGADTDMSLVNWRDIFATSLKSKVKPGQEVEIEVYKNGWEEYCRVGDVEGRGSSKGKSRWMPSYQFGVWVHQMRASFDDMYITIEMTDEFLALNNLKGVIEKDPSAKPPTEGPLAGLEGIPPTVLKQILEYQAGKGSHLKVVDALAKGSLDKKVRQAIAQVIIERNDPRVVPILVDNLYSEDRDTRKLAIFVVKSIVGKDFGYSYKSSEKKRSKAIRKLNDHMLKDQKRYYGS